MCHQCQGSHRTSTVHSITVLIFLHVWVRDVCALSLIVYLCYLFIPLMKCHVVFPVHSEKIVRNLNGLE